MNNKHTFKINQHPVPGWFDPTTTTRPVPPFWNIAPYVNGEFRQSFRPYSNECEAEQVVNCPMHTMYGNVVHNRWNAFDQGWAHLQEQLNQYLTVAHSIRIRQKEAC